MYIHILTKLNLPSSVQGHVDMECSHVNWTASAPLQGFLSLSSIVMWAKCPQQNRDASCETVVSRAIQPQCVSLYTDSCAENVCLQDESTLCPIFEAIGICDHSLAMGDNGLRCCDTCLGIKDEDYEYLY